MEDEKKFKTTTSIWTDNIEENIKEIGEACSGYKWMNIEVARKDEIKYNILIYMSIILGPISGIFSVISTGKENEILQIMITVFSFLSGIISAIIKFSNFGEKSNTHKSIAAKYASLESNIKRQLSLSRIDRVNAGDYLEWISVSFDELFSSSPLINDNIYDMWINIAKTNKLTIPRNLQRNMSIVVNKCENANTVSMMNTENAEIPVHIQKTDLSRYSDGKMKYEMNRLVGHGRNI